MKNEKLPPKKKIYSSQVRYFIREISVDGLIKRISGNDCNVYNLFDERDGYDSIGGAQKAIDDYNLNEIKDSAFPYLHRDLIIVPFVKVKYE